jgi:hypothetical protein
LERATIAALENPMLKLRPFGMLKNEAIKSLKAQTYM